jgi:radical SAM protein with 4Fe4S-binding SPASM domain
MSSIRDKLSYYIRPDKNKAIKLKKSRLNYYPDTIWIEPTNYCNYKCKYCPITTGLRRSKGFISLDLFQKIINDISPFMKGRWISLHFLGEPLLHKRISELVRIAKDNGIKVLFFTNGSLLTIELFEILCCSGLDRLTFSLDATNKTDYEELQVGGKWDEVITNVKNAVDFKRKRNIDILLTINHLAKNKSEFITGKQQLEELFKGEDILIRGHIYHDWAGNVETGGKRYIEQRVNRRPCNFLFSAMVITWDGLVIPCTQDAHAELIVGDAGKENIMDIWNSKRFVSLRSKSLTCDYNLLLDVCKRCIQSTEELIHL